MENKYISNKEQSEKLINFGVKRETADFIVTFSEDGNIDNMRLNLCNDFKEGEFPAWSIITIASLCPNSIVVDDAMYDLNLCLGINSVSYSLEGSYAADFFVNSQLFDNLLDCIEWLIEENLINSSDGN